MAAPTLEQVMVGLETRLATIAGLNVSEFVPDNINPPQAIVGVPPWDRQAMRKGVMTLDATVTVLTSRNYDRTGQLKLASYASFTGADSVLLAIEGDKTLGSVVSDCTVLRFRPTGVEEVAAYGYFGGVFDLLITATGA